MKVSKLAANSARRLFGLCSVSGRLDESKLSEVISKLVETKPRDYAAILVALRRLARLELERRTVWVESAVALQDSERSEVESKLQQQYGQDLQVHYQVTPALLGGMKIRVADDVLDGSVQGRLERLSQTF